MSKGNQHLNGLAGTTVAVAIVFLMLGISIGEIADNVSSESSEDYGVMVPVWERGNRIHNRPRQWFRYGIWSL